LDEIDDPIDVVALVAEYNAAGDGLVEEFAGRRHIVRLTGREHQAQGQATVIDQRMDLCRQPAA